LSHSLTRDRDEVGVEVHAHELRRA
jgi:hypothetical protein